MWVRGSHPRERCRVERHPCLAGIHATLEFRAFSSRNGRHGAVRPDIDRPPVTLDPASAADPASVRRPRTIPDRLGRTGGGVDAEPQEIAVDAEVVPPESARTRYGMGMMGASQPLFWGAG